MYIARSVCRGKLSDWIHSLIGVPMPTLTDEAKRLYVNAHGQERYDRFTEKNPFTRHGAIPPSVQPKALPPAVHRPRHNAESIFWTMLVALLRAQPQYGAREERASRNVTWIWQKLHDHEIPEEPGNDQDERESILGAGRSFWENCFHLEMRKVARLLFNIKVQVLPEYELWTPAPPEDHLHEAMQRLILQYLVDHRDQDIPLDPSHQRPTQIQPRQSKSRDRGTSTSTQIHATYDSRGTAQRRGRGTGPRSSGQKTSRSKAKASVSQASVVAGSSPGFKNYDEGASGASNVSLVPTVVDPKRKSESYRMRANKRLKGMSGSPMSIEEDDKDDKY